MIGILSPRNVLQLSYLKSICAQVQDAKAFATQSPGILGQ